jgi:hypothetical protein
MASIHMANSDVIDVKETVDAVVGQVLKAKKENRPIILLHVGDDPIWLNLDQINSIK